VVDGEDVAELLDHIDETDVDLSHSGLLPRQASPTRCVSASGGWVSSHLPTPCAHLLRVAERWAEDRCRP
jgi:hypothetical protein